MNSDKISFDNLNEDDIFLDDVPSNSESESEDDTDDPDFTVDEPCTSNPVVLEVCETYSEDEEENKKFERPKSI